MYSASARICSARLLPSDDSPNGRTSAFPHAARLIYRRIVRGRRWHALCADVVSQKRRIPMLEQGRYPTHEEIEAIIARARHMRAQYVGALIARGALRLKQLLIGPRPQRGSGTRRFRADMG
jgi:hypothetical protein